MRRLAIGLALALVVTACSLEIPTVTGPVLPGATNPTVEPVVIDIGDDALMEQLGVGAPADIKWLRKLPGVDLVGITPEIVPEEHDLLAAALGDLPPQLSIRPRLIVRTSIPPTVESEDPFAVTRGPDIWVFDDTFRWDGGGVGRLTMVRVLAHELTHVAQFATLDPAVVGAVAAGVSGDLSLTNSALVADFVEAVGWSQGASGAWTLSGPAATPYGETGPVEDMAESVALVAAGLGDAIPAAQRTWVEGWLGASADRIASGKPWAPGNAVEVLSGTPLYDVDRVTRLTGEREAEVLTYQLPTSAPDAGSLAAEVARRLGARGMPGTLGRVEDASILRYAGQFQRPDGTIVWAELWDFREAPGYTNAPEGPALSYVVIYPENG